MNRHLEILPVILSAAKDLARLLQEILRCAQDDSLDTSQARSREVLSPNVYQMKRIKSLQNSLKSTRNKM